MKEEKKENPTFQVTDPKPPIIHSGHMEGRKR